MKRHPQLRDLSDDHHDALLLARRCRRASRSTQREVWSALRRAFQEQLELHFAIEEAHLLPALELLGERAMVGRIREDHAALRALGAERTPSLAQVHDFGRGLERHVRFEEREVFERTQDRLPSAALAALDRACKQRLRFCGTTEGAG